MAHKVIITGASGMVGEGVLLECIANDEVADILVVGRKACGQTHPKVTEYLVPDFLDMKIDDAKLAGYDACFFCAGISSVGMKEEVYTKITFDTTIHFAEVVSAQNPQMTFIYVSGAGTDSSEKGSSMWARVKGKTENTLVAMPFKQVYNFRPGFMKLTPGQKNALPLYKYIGWMFPFFKFILPNSTSTIRQVGRAMIKVLDNGSEKHVVDVKTINELGNL